MALSGGVCLTRAGLRPNTFEEVVREHHADLYAFATRLLGRDPDDTLQNAYLRAYQAWPHYRETGSVSAWLFRILYRCCVDELRGRKRRKLLSARLDLRSLKTTSDHGADQSSQTAAIAAALASLPIEQRSAVLLVDVHGMDYGEAADILGLPRGTLSSRLTTARRTLRERLRPLQEEL